MTTLTKTWPRRIVISIGFGAGLSTWWHLDEQQAYDIIEHPTLIAAVEEHLGWRDTLNRLEAAGFDRDILDQLYDGGWEDAIVATVHGPYKVYEYDGSEYVIERDNVDWRM